MKISNNTTRAIDYRLNILGIRVWENACQLIAKSGDGSWSGIGPRWDLPVSIPQNSEELKLASADTLRLTAYQYTTERPRSDLAGVLSKTVDFSIALQSSPSSD